MEIKETIIRKVEGVIHHFYCDDCNKHLGDSTEFEDGYYAKHGEFEMRIYFPDGWHKVKKMFM